MSATAFCPSLVAAATSSSSMKATLAGMAWGGGGAAGACVAGAWGLAVCAIPAVVKTPAARAETSTSLEFMCCAVLLQDPSGSSLSSNQATARPHVLDPLHPGPRLQHGQSLSLRPVCNESHSSWRAATTSRLYGPADTRSEEHLLKSGACQPNSPDFWEALSLGWRRNRHLAPILPCGLMASELL